MPDDEDVLKGPNPGEDLYGPRTVLNELKHRPERSLERASLVYVHRGAPGERKLAMGGDVLELDASFLTLRTDGGPTRIPYHRVRDIRYDDEPVWRRKEGGGIELPGKGPELPHGSSS